MKRIRKGCDTNGWELLNTGEFKKEFVDIWTI